MSKTQEKEDPLRNILEIFFLDTLKTTFWTKNLTQRPKQSWDGIQNSFQNQDTFHLFRFLKRAKEASPLPPLVFAPVSVAEYAPVSLNITKYPWKCFNKLFWICQGSEYAWSSFMFDRLLKMPRILNKQGFWIWKRCICKGYAIFQYAWTWLNIAESPRICPKFPE